MSNPRRPQPSRSRTRGLFALTPLLIASLTSTGAHAQSLCLRKTTTPTLGKTFTIRADGAPTKNVLMLPSLTTGPISLSAINPGDTRKLAVGTELVSAWTLLPKGGSRDFRLPLPLNASLAGVDLRIQAVSLPGSPFVIDRISNVAIGRLGLAGQSQALTASFAIARALAVTARAGNGCRADRLLTIGGGQGSLTSARGLATTELFDASDNSVRPGPRLGSARALAVALPLDANRTIVIGGIDGSGAALATCEIYDARTNAFTAAASMSTPRAGHAGTVLANGRILVAGGTTTLADPVAALNNVQNSAEIFNPTTGTWSRAAALPRRLLLPSLDRLPNGRVLLSGGFEVRRLFGFPLPVGTVTSCSTYRTSANSWSPAPSMRTARAGHGLNSVALPNGDILITGGAQSGADLTKATPIADAEVFRAGSSSWQALARMATPRFGHSATLLADGSVVVAGGAVGTISAPRAVASVQRLPRGATAWRALPNLATARAGHAAYATSAGALILLGGQNSTGTTVRTVEQIVF